MELKKGLKKINLNLNYEIELEDPIVIYRLNGKITSDVDYENLENEVFSMINKNYYRVVFNLENLSHTNSSGISFFMRTLTKTRIMGGELVLTNVIGNVEKIFNIAKLNEIYTICDNQQDGINHFNTK